MFGYKPERDSWNDGEDCSKLEYTYFVDRYQARFWKLKKYGLHTAGQKRKFLDDVIEAVSK